MLILVVLVAMVMTTLLLSSLDPLISPMWWAFWRGGWSSGPGDDARRETQRAQGGDATIAVLRLRNRSRRVPACNRKERDTMSVMVAMRHVSPMHRLLVVGTLAVLAALLVIPRAASQETHTLDLEVSYVPESAEYVLAEGSPPPGFLPARGDVWSAQGAVTAAGDAGGERVGTFYFMGVGTSMPEHVATAGNHLFATGTFEIFGQGSFVVTGVFSVTKTSYVAITGGTGSYVGAIGQCVYTGLGEYHDRWSCEFH